MSVNEPYEVKYLASKTGLSASIVRNVVKQQGPMRSRVESYLCHMGRNGKG